MGENISRAEVPTYYTVNDTDGASQVENTTRENFDTNGGELELPIAAELGSYPPDEIDEDVFAALGNAVDAEQVRETTVLDWPACFKEGECVEAEIVTVPDQYSSCIAEVFEGKENSMNLPARGKRAHLPLVSDTDAGKYTVSLYENNDIVVARETIDDDGEPTVIQQGYYINSCRYDSDLVVCADESGYLETPLEERSLHALEGTDTPDRAIGRQEWKLLKHILETAKTEKPTFEEIWEAAVDYDLHMPAMADTKDGAIEMKRYVTRAVAAAPARRKELRIHEINDAGYSGILVAEADPETEYQGSVVQYTVSLNSANHIGGDTNGSLINITHMQKINDEGLPAASEEDVVGEKSRAIIVVAEQQGGVSCMIYEGLKFGEEEIPADPIMVRVDTTLVRALRDFLDNPSV